MVDAKVGFTGGLNISRGYINTRAHTRSSPRWHDVFVRVVGDTANDIERNFAGIWNHELPRFKSFVKRVNELNRGKKIPVQKITKISVSQIKPSRPAKSRPLAQIHRTLSVSKKSSKIPSPVRTDIEEGYINAIRLAEDYIYLENQYLRVPQIADQIVKRYLQLRRMLRVIIVLPVIPEEVMIGKADAITEHGAFLQNKTLKRLRDVLGKDLGLYSMVQKKRGKNRAKLKASFGSESIYVHSKILIIDDVYSGIGTANANSRGFRMDTELHLSWHSSKETTAFRINLWNELLGKPKNIEKWKPQDYIKNWDKIAQRNTRISATRRDGFIIPHDLDLIEGKRSLVIPDEYAELFNIDPDRRLKETAVV